MKRAHLLLFTLFFLLLGTSAAWGQYTSSPVKLAGSDFISKTGSYPCAIADVIYFGDESITTSWTKVSGTRPGQGQYSISNGSFYSGERGTNSKLFSHRIDGLVTASGFNKHTIKIYFKASGRVEIQAIYATPGTTNNNYKQKQTDGSSQELSLEFEINATASSFSYYLERQGGSGTLEITRIEIWGYAEPKITSTLGFGVCAGNTTTLQVLGHSGAIQWQVAEDPAGPWTNVAGATTSQLDVQVTKTQYYKVGSIVSKKLEPTMCCAYEANPNYIAEIRFDMGTTASTPQDLPPGASIDRTPDTGYKFITEGDFSNKIEDGEYAVVHRTIDGGYWADSPNVSTICGKDYATNRNDGFLLVNCNPDNSGSPMYEQIVSGLCENAMHNFSISVVSVDVHPEHEGIAVKMQVYAMPSGAPLLTDPITIRKSCGEGWGDPYSTSITTPIGCTSVKISIINANTSGIAAGNDVGIDDILFSRCNPEIALFANADRSATELKYCPTNETASLYVGEPANLDIIFPNGKWYYYQEKVGGTWSELAPATPNNSLAVSPTTETTYRVTVAGSAETAEAAATGRLTNGGCTSYAQSNEVTIKPECNCQASTAPTTSPYNACPSETKLDLNTLITNRSNTGTYYWYTTATGGTPMSDTEAQNIDVSRYDATNPTRTYYVSYDQDGDTDTYCESERTAVTVTLKPQSAGINTTGLVPDDYCRNDLPTLAGYMTSTTDPQTVWTWHKVDAAGNVIRPLNDLSGNNTNVGSSAFSFVVMEDDTTPFYIRVSSESPNYCAKSDVFLHGYIHENTNFTLSAPDEVCAAAPEVTLTLTNMEGTGDLVIKKGSTVLKTEPNFSGTEYTFTDNTAHGNVASVTYTITFGNATMCGKEVLHTVLIGTNMDVPLTSNATGDRVCEGTKVTIRSNRPVNNSSNETYTWYKNGTLVTGVTGSVFADPDALTENTTYKAEVTNGACDGEGEITITVDKDPVVVLDITRENICHGDTSTVQIDYSDPSVVIPAGSTFAWNATYTNGVDAPAPYTNFNTTSATGLKQHTFEQAGNYGFELTVTNGTCDTKSAPVDFWVAGAPQFTLSASETTICQDNPTTLMITMASDKAAEVTDKKWTLNGATVSGEFTESTQGANTIFSMETTPTQVGKLTYKAEVTALCSASKTIDITVVEGIIASIQEEFEICEDDDVELELQLQTTGEYSYKWTPNNGLSDNSIQRPMASPATDMTYTVEINTKEGDCPAYKTTNVKVHPKPIIESITETGIRQITAVADDKTEWPTFRIDDIDNTYENSPVVISNVPIGYHRLYITNEYGCENSQVFEVSPVPVIPKKFFTPNDEGDPENNYWTIDGLDAYTSWIVEIYDRYGRRLYEHRTGSFSKEGNSGSDIFKWDGMYNGHQMPSDDYWYLITVEEIRKQYSGHFTLKR